MYVLFFKFMLFIIWLDFNKNIYIRVEKQRSTGIIEGFLPTLRLIAPSIFEV